MLMKKEWWVNYPFAVNHVLLIRKHFLPLRIFFLLCISNVIVFSLFTLKELDRWENVESVESQMRKKMLLKIVTYHLEP